AQPPVGQTDAAVVVQVKSRGVGAAVNQRLPHPGHVPPLVARGRPEVDDPCDPTHEVLASARTGASAASAPFGNCSMPRPPKGFRHSSPAGTVSHPRPGRILFHGPASNILFNLAGQELLESGERAAFPIQTKTTHPASA